MTGLTALWLPIVVSAVFVYLASSIIHMVLPWHKGDYPRMPGEEKFRAAVGPMNIPPGDYIVPRCDSMAEMKSPEFLAKMKEGPVMVMTVMPNGQPSMARNLSQWFVYLLVVGVFAGYVAGRALPPGSEYLHVFRFAGATAFCAYSLALAQMSIWYQRGWRITLLSMFDGLIYALLTAGTFGWLWPK